MDFSKLSKVTDSLVTGKKQAVSADGLVVDDKTNPLDALESRSKIKDSKQTKPLSTSSKVLIIDSVFIKRLKSAPRSQRREFLSKLSDGHRRRVLNMLHEVTDDTNELGWTLLDDLMSNAVYEPNDYNLQNLEKFTKNQNFADFGPEASSAVDKVLSSQSLDESDVSLFSDKLGGNSRLSSVVNGKDEKDDEEVNKDKGADAISNVTGASTVKTSDSWTPPVRKKITRKQLASIKDSATRLVRAFLAHKISFNTLNGRVTDSIERLCDSTNDQIRSYKAWWDAIDTAFKEQFTPKDDFKDDPTQAKAQGENAEPLDPTKKQSTDPVEPTEGTDKQKGSKPTKGKKENIKPKAPKEGTDKQTGGKVSDAVEDKPKDVPSGKPKNLEDEDKDDPKDEETEGTPSYEDFEPAGKDETLDELSQATPKDENGEDIPTEENVVSKLISALEAFAGGDDSKLASLLNSTPDEALEEDEEGNDEPEAPMADMPEGEDEPEAPLGAHEENGEGTNFSTEDEEEKHEADKEKKFSLGDAHNLAKYLLSRDKKANSILDKLSKFTKLSHNFKISDCGMPYYQSEPTAESAMVIPLTEEEFVSVCPPVPDPVFCNECASVVEPACPAVQSCEVCGNCLNINNGQMYYPYESTAEEIQERLNTAEAEDKSEIVGSCCVTLDSAMSIASRLNKLNLIDSRFFKRGINDSGWHFDRVPEVLKDFTSTGGTLVMDSKGNINLFGTKYSLQ